MRLTQRLSLRTSLRDQHHKALPIVNIPPYRQGLQPFQFINGRIIGIADNKTNYIDKGYSINDMIYSIVNLIIDKLKTPEWGVYKVVDEQSLKAMKALLRKGTLYGKDYLEMLDLRRKAVEPVKGGSKLHDLLERPNRRETWNDYIGNSEGYNLLTGDDFTAATLLNMGANSGMPQEIYCLPAQDTTIVASNTFPTYELGYILNTLQINYVAELVMHSFEWNPEYSTNGLQLYGMSPLKAALSTVARSNASVKAGASMFHNMGIAGVLYVDDNRFDAEEGLTQANAVKQLLHSEYTGPDNHGKISTSGYKLGWQSIGLSPVDLAIIESERWDYHKFCNVYRVPPELMGLTQKTYNNAKEAEAALTTRVTIPRLNRKRAALNHKFHTDWGVKEKNIIVDYDPSVFSELRMSAKEVAEYTQQVLMITANEQRALMYMDARKEPEADELMVKTGDRQFLSDYQANIVDQDLNEPQDDE